MGSGRSVKPVQARCLVCGGATLARSLFGGHRYLGKTYYRLRCRGCGFIFVDPMPDVRSFEAMYDNSYFANYYGGGEDIGYEGSLESGMACAVRVLSKIAEHKTSGSLLDIGCAGGHFLAEAQKRGYACLGVELNKEMAEHARKTFGLEVLDGSFEAAGLEQAGRRFDVIYMGDSLEHLPDPKGTLVRVYRLLSPDGIFVLNGPLTLNASLFTVILRLKLLMGKGRSEWYSDNPPYHLWEWNARTMRQFLEQCGFLILDFATWEAPGRPCEVLTRVLNRPLTMKESGAERLKDVSAWCTNTFLRSFKCGDRVIALAKRAAKNHPALSSR